MKKTIEKPFFEAFEAIGGLVDNCLSYMDEIYNLGICPKERDNSPQRAKYFNEVLPQKIREQFEAFNDTVILFQDSPLMEEIEANLQECTSQQSQERYLFSLLKPFKAFADKYTPIATIAQLEQSIKETQKNLAFWQAQPQDEIIYNDTGQSCGTPKEQVEACYDTIKRRTQAIERHKHISNQYRILTGRFDEGAKWTQKGTVEACLSYLGSIAYKFANRLDALLLTYGIDLLRLQRDSGIYLKEYRHVTDVSYYIGSLELAQKYIDALPKYEGGKPQQKAKEKPKQSGRQSRPFKDEIIRQPTEETLTLLHSLIDGKKGKNAIIYLAIAIVEGIISRPTSTQILQEFGDIGHKSLICKYLDKGVYTNDEIIVTKEALKG